MSDSVPPLDLRAQYSSIRDEIDAAVASVFSSQAFILGETVAAFERELAEYCGAAYAVGVSSGTDALLASLMVLVEGEGDVITSPFSFFATAGCIVRAGLRPVLVDIEAETFNIDAGAMAEKITERTRAIMPVHLFGRCADLDAIQAAAGALPIIEDAAQAIGARFAGRAAGTVGTVGCFSFYPTKNLGGAGDGGMVVTGDKAIFEKLFRIRHHGQSSTYHHELVGGNFRLDALQAAVLRVKLRHLEEWTEARIRAAQRYRRLFADTGLAPESVRLPPAARDGDHRDVYHQFVIRVAVDRRDALIDHMRSRDVGASIYYPVPLHLQPCFADLGYREGDLPNAERAAREVIALPMYPELTDAQAERVVEVVKEGLAT